MSFQSRLAIIAGGVGGIGSAVGKLFYEKGASLALLYAPFEKHLVAKTLESTYKDHTRIRTYECDVISPQSVEDAFSAVAADAVTSPAFLVNSAGYVNLCPLSDAPPNDILKHYMVNLYGPTLTGQAFLKIFRAANAQSSGGRIINIASQAAHVALDQHGAYCASKAGLLGLTRSQASEWAKYGLTANSISPGPVWTALGKKAWADDKVREEYQQAVPTGHFAEPDEVAQLVLSLCQDASKNINGADIRLDGGFTVR